MVIGMYHDQVLGPIKTLFEYDAINITWITFNTTLIMVLMKNGWKKYVKSTQFDKSIKFLDKI